MAFVKFSRGLKSIYQNLAHKDNDTLYLVYDTNDSETGSLYLGNKLISSVSNSSSLSLNDLTDVAITGNLEDGMLLHYNQSTGQGKWEAISLSELLEDIPSTGLRDNISIVNSLNNIQNPQEKDIAVVNNNVYIRNNNAWEQLTDSNLATRISNLENQIGTSGDSGEEPTGLYKKIVDLKEEILESIGDLSHLTYQIVNNLQDIDVTAEEAATTIYLVPKNDNQENDGYDEYFVINGNLEKIGTLADLDLSNYARLDDNRFLSAEQIKKVNAITLDEDDNIIIQAAQVSDLTDVIRENQLIKSVAGVFNITDEGELQLKAVPSIDLSDYVTYDYFESTVGDINALQNNTIIDEINELKTSVIWQNITAQ